jgi:hypothetical protein
MEKIKNKGNRLLLRMMTSIHTEAEARSAREGVSLNQFINIAVAEKLAQMKQAEWAATRMKVTPAAVMRALEILDKGGNNPPEPWDRLPPGHVSSEAKTKKARSSKR